MATSVTFPSIGGTTYSVPTDGELNWQSLSTYLIALATAQGTTSQKKAIRRATTTPVTVISSSDCVINVQLTTPAAASVVLPVSPQGQFYSVIDGTGDAGTNNITVTASGGATINGAASYVIGYNRASADFVYITAANNWLVSFQSNAPTTTTLQQAYANTVPATINLTAASAGLNVRDAATPIGVNLFSVTDTAGTTFYLRVSAAGLISPTLVTPALGTPASGVMTNVTGTAAGLTAGNVTTNANLTGDVTSAGNASTLATVNANVGSFGSATQAIALTVNAKGLLTAAANVAIQLATSAAVTGLDAALALKAPLENPTFTGVVTTPAGTLFTTPIIAGGTASNTSRWTVPKDTLTNLTALTRVEGVIVYATDTDKFYSDDGTNLNEVGSGSSSGINYLLAPSLAVSTIWTRTGTTGAAGNAPATTFTAGDLPLSPVITTAIKLLSATSAGAEATAYVEAAFTTPATGAVKTQVSLFMRIGSNFIASEWTVSVYQSTTRQSLSSDSSSITYLPANTGNFNFTFDALASTAYTLRFARTVNAGANAAQLNLASVYVGPGVITQGAAISAISPTVTYASGTGLTPTNELTFQRVGEYIAINGRLTFTADGSSGGVFGISLSGFTLSAKQCGAVRVNLAVTDLVRTYHMSVTAGILELYTSNTGVADAQIAGTSCGTTSGRVRVIQFESLLLKVDEWAGNGTVNLGAGAQVEYMSDDGTADVFGPNGSLVPNVAASTGTTTRALSFTYPNQVTQDLRVEINYRGFGWSQMSDAFPYMQGNNGSASNAYGCTGRWSSATVFSVYFGNQGIAISASNVTAGEASWATEFAAGTRFRVAKANPSSPVGFGLAGTDGSSGLYKPGQAPGLVTGAAISAGYVGEIYRVGFSGGNLTTTVSARAATITLPSAGTWLVYIQNGFAGTATSTTILQSSANTTDAFSATRSATVSFGQMSVAAFSLNPLTEQTVCLGSLIVNSSSAPIIHIWGNATFTGGTCNQVGYVTAVRIA